MIWKIDHAVKTEGVAASSGGAMISTDFNKLASVEARCNFSSVGIIILASTDFMRSAHCSMRRWMFQRIDRAHLVNLLDVAYAIFSSTGGPHSRGAANLQAKSQIT
jgi:hypothetical protein